MDITNEPIERNTEIYPIRPQKTYRSILVFFGFLIFFTILLVFVSPPKLFPKNTFIEIENGTSLIGASKKLQEENIIRSKIIFQAIMISLGNEKGVMAGEYYFDTPVSVFEVARMLRFGDYNYKQIKVTIPEGYQLKEMARVFGESLPLFNEAEFLSIAKEGYLFPDTYFFSPNATTADIVKRMTDRFDEVIKKYQKEIDESGKSLEEIITMASIIEKEGSGDTDRPTISGILWKRIEIGMALQVDATFLYINGKGSSELTKKDLALDHKYNTYKYRGLPPGPIGSPGEASIQATLNPVTTEYLYYLHSKDGTAYFSKTYEEHLRNKRKYLD